MVKIDTKVLAKQLKESADYLADHKEQGGCCHFNTVEMDDKGINKNVSIVLGWTDGFDAEEQDKYSDDTWRLAVKVGYQPVNSIMQYDYDIDFNHVWYENTGDVYETEAILYSDSNFESIAESLIKDFNHILHHWNNYKHD